MLPCGLYARGREERCVTLFQLSSIASAESNSMVLMRYFCTNFVQPRILQWILYLAHFDVFFRIFWLDFSSSFWCVFSGAVQDQHLKAEVFSKLYRPMDVMANAVSKISDDWKECRFRRLNYKKACGFQKASTTCRRVFDQAWIQNSRRQRQATLLGAHSTHKRSMFLRIFYFPARLLQNPTHKPSASSSRSLQPTTHIGEEYIDYTTWTPILQITHNQKPTVCYAYWEGKPEISPFSEMLLFLAKACRTAS